uniref:Uncharacterized protein n=1 Tax=Pseudo-nitzschia delicatissima TaxID=44447 RepID=A0A7S0UEP4_9STRA|mmetsp:Transcript_1255/g.2564  ORF Transcript_1255/g.2564 Transcript_1255/m.2564 type:complete len:494 (+) Transcript_1255:99-1580(+)|eukprot:CAMPEP_0197267094 /NCGR_PEP_ID=MMETSP1432-20130617/3392_1 /TAXON_ID=44447 /ORGANISM="Pseudo-nitzschia delicatissima, Strain UNC1205" /LENGTH=493 /DNA_ID=CAMNT_0042732023 /DNA_START=87 /DNA_END=1568 /DNA_ORIENTATION=-
MMLNALSSAKSLAKSTARRSIHSRRKMKNPVDLPKALVANFPVKKTKPSSDTTTTPAAEEPLYSAPVTSAHAIDLEKNAVSTLDSAAIDPSSGKVIHGRYGELDADATLGVPLEYLALLRQAAEGAAGLSKMGSGTVLVYGASQANGFAAVQMAAKTNAVVGVVDGQHSGNEDMVEYVKGVIPEPGTAVGQEYAIAKKNFKDLVSGIATGDEQLGSYTAAECLEDFKANLADYSEAYPDTMPAAVNSSKIKFLGMEKDKEQFRANIDTYLSQYQPGAPPLSKDQLDATFNTDQYEVFRNKFWDQTTSVVSGDESHFFSPPHIVQDLMKEPEQKPPSTPFSFSTLSSEYPMGTEAASGGPVAGAIVAVTPDLKVAAEAVAKAKTLRGKAEALAFLTDAQKDAFAAATSVAAQAQAAGAPVVTIGGSLPGFETAEPTDADVSAALSAMAIQDDGSTDLDYFVQAYRAGDFPFYADYAVHRATEPLAGPRQIVVTK